MPHKCLDKSGDVETLYQNRCANADVQVRMNERLPKIMVSLTLCCHRLVDFDAVCDFCG